MGIKRKAKLLAEYLEGKQIGRPEEATELFPLLELARRLEAMRRPELRPEVLASGLVRAQEGLAGRRSGPRSRLWRMAWALVAFLLALILGTTGLVLAAEGSLPGEPLYPIKRGSEYLRLALATAPGSRSTLLLSFAERRLDEVAVVCSPAGCPGDLLADLGDQTEDAAGEIERLPEEKQVELLERLVDLTTRQQEVLRTLLERTSGAARPGLERALERSRQGQERARQKLERRGQKFHPDRPSVPPGGGPKRSPSP